MSLVDYSTKPKPCWEFEANVMILQHATTIRQGYTPVAHIGVVRQSVRIMEMSKDSKSPVELMRAGDRGLVRFRFLYQAELITPKTAILLREGNAMIIGKITTVIEA